MLQLAGSILDIMRKVRANFLHNSNVQYCRVGQFLAFNKKNQVAYGQFLLDFSPNICFFLTRYTDCERLLHGYLLLRVSIFSECIKLRKWEEYWFQKGLALQCEIYVKFKSTVRLIYKKKYKSNKNSYKS